MAFSIITKNGEKTFNEKELVNISSKEGFDVKLDVDFDCSLTVQYDLKNNKCSVLNQLNNEKFLFKGKPIPAILEVDKVCKIMIDGTDEFLTVKVLGRSTSTEIAEENLTEEDVKNLYGQGINASAMLKIEKRNIYECFIQ